MIEQIKTYRQQLNLSQAEFADRFGLPRQTYTQWERGRREPESSAKLLLAVILDSPDTVQRIVRRMKRREWAQEAQTLTGPTETEINHAQRRLKALFGEELLMEGVCCLRCGRPWKDWVDRDRCGCALEEQ